MDSQNVDSILDVGNSGTIRHYLVSYMGNVSINHNWWLINSKTSMGRIIVNGHDEQIIEA